MSKSFPYELFPPIFVTFHFPVFVFYRLYQKIDEILHVFFCITPFNSLSYTYSIGSSANTPTGAGRSKCPSPPAARHYCADLFLTIRPTASIIFISLWQRFSVAVALNFIRVWRSLVSRLVRVQEAVGSNPATRTKKVLKRKFPGFLFLS